MTPAPSQLSREVDRPRGAPRPTPGRRWRGFVRRYGWRAYALVALMIITVVAIFTTDGGGAKPATTAAGGRPTTLTTSPAAGTSAASGPSTAATDSRLKIDRPGAGALNEALASDQLPPGGPYTQQGTGAYTAVAGTSAVIGTAGAIQTFTIEVEGGITGVDVAAFTSSVMTTLSDNRSWIAGKNVRLQRVASGTPDFRVTLVSSLTVRQLCGYDQQIETSCYNDGRVVLNVARWVRGDAAYIADLASYHLYMINHEFGHALGHSHAHDCLSNGYAPVMMQQTISLVASNSALCQSNPWPFPTGVSDAPGTEIVGT